MRNTEHIMSYEAALDQFIAQILKEEDISPAEWEYRMDELSDEPDVVPTKYEIEAAQATWAEFQAHLKRFKLPTDNRFQLCEKLYAKSVTAPTAELTQLYCNIVCNSSFLLDSECNMEQMAACWHSQRKQTDDLYQYMMQQQQISTRFQQSLNQIARKKMTQYVDTAYEPEETERIARLYIRCFPQRQAYPALKGNIASLLQLIQSSEELILLKPLLLYRILTRHGKRFLQNDMPCLDFRTLWQYRYYQVDSDNGKNYKTYIRYLHFFQNLCVLSKRDSSVDVDLCVYGFDHLSNLGEFCRLYLEDDTGLSFGRQVEDFFLETPFTCFPNGYNDNVILQRYKLTAKELDRFQSSQKPVRICALRRVSAYMNRNLINLTRRFIDGGASQAEILCREILEAAALPRAQRPASEKEQLLFLAAIHAALMQAEDDWAEDYLIRAGKALCGDDVLQKGLNQ